jgi:hypothetical protein
MTKSNAAKAMAEEVRKYDAGGKDNITISAYNYGVRPDEKFLTSLRALLPAGWTARDDGFMGYIAFRKAKTK